MNRRNAEETIQKIADDGPDPATTYALASSGIPLDKVRLSVLLKAAALDIEATAFCARYTGTEYPNERIAGELKRRAMVLVEICDQVRREPYTDVGGYRTELLEKIGEMFS